MPEVTVATLNLFHRQGRLGERLPLLVEQLLEVMPDVIGFQEVDLVIDQGNWIAHLLNGRVGANLYTVHHVTSPGRLARWMANAVMTRLPVRAHETLDLMYGERTAQRVRLEAANGEFDFYNTHLHHPVDAVDVRRQQARRLIDWMSEWEGPRAVVGDFNARPDEPAVALLKERLASAYEVANGGEPERTWPTPINTFDPDPPGCLDYVFVSGVEVRDCRLAFDRHHEYDATLYPSDHLGLMARLEVG